MSSKAFTGSGVTVSIGTPGSGETFVPISEIKSVSWTNPKLQTEDATNLSSPTLGAATIKEQIPTVIDPGQMTAQVLYIPTDPGLIALNTAFLSTVVHDFKVQYPPLAVLGQTTTGTLYAFQGYVLEQPLPDGIDVTKLTMYKLTVQLVTSITVTPGS